MRLCCVRFSVCPVCALRGCNVCSRPGLLCLQPAPRSSTWPLFQHASTLHLSSLAGYFSPQLGGWSSRPAVPLVAPSAMLADRDTSGLASPQALPRSSSSLSTGATPTRWRTSRACSSPRACRQRGCCVKWRAGRCRGWTSASARRWRGQRLRARPSQPTCCAPPWRLRGGCAPLPSWSGPAARGP